MPRRVAQDLVRPRADFPPPPDHLWLKGHHYSRPLPERLDDSPTFKDQFVLVAPDLDQRARVLLAALQRVGTLVVEDVLPEVVVHPRDLLRRLCLGEALGHASIDLSKHLLQLRNRRLEIRMGLALIGEVLLHLRKKLKIGGDPAPDMGDEGEPVAQALLDLVVLLLLLSLRVDAPQDVPHAAGGATLVLILVALDVKNILARPGTQAAPGEVNDGHHLGWSLRDAVQRIDDYGAFQNGRPVRGPKIDVPLRIGPGGVVPVTF